MKTGLVLGLQLLVASAAAPAELDRVCRNGYCDILSVQGGVVRFTDPLRTLELGKYLQEVQDLVSKDEAPIRSLLSPRRWRIVVSAFLDHSDESQAGLRVRFFGPDGRLRGTDVVLMALEQLEIGRLFGVDDDVLAVQSGEEHSYNSRTNIWLLPELGAPKLLMDASATFGKFSKGNGSRAGVWINRQTYDGVRAETKGWVSEFWRWDANSKSLALQRE